MLSVCYACTFNRERMADNWLFAQFDCKHFCMCYRQNRRQKGRVQARETENICEEVAPGHSVNWHQGIKDTLSLPLKMHTHTLTKYIFEELLQWGQLIKWRYSEEERIKAFFKMTLHRSWTPPLCSSLCPLPHFLHLQTHASSSAWPQGGSGEADTDVIHSPPV